MGYHVVLIPGDGIGPEITKVACKVLDATGVELFWDVQEVGAPAIQCTGEGLPRPVLDAVRSAGVALKGPVSTSVGTGGARSVNVALRRELDLFAQVRPCRSWPGVASPLGRADLVVIRDTTEGLYAGAELDSGAAETTQLLALLNERGYALDPTCAFSLKPLSARACRRVLRFAFDYAVAHGRRRITAVHKATVMRRTDGVFREIAREMSPGYPTVELDDQSIDTVCARLARDPASFDVLVTLNLYGDILSDLAAAITGGVGLAPGANLGPGAAIFEAAHGTAPRHAGLHRANPMGLVLSGALLLRHLGEGLAAGYVESAVAALLAQGRTLTYDVAPAGSAAPASTESVGEALIREVRAARSTVAGPSAGDSRVSRIGTATGSTSRGSATW